MSTFYFLCCAKHQVKGPLMAGRSFPDRWWGPDGDESVAIAAFVQEHQSCKDIEDPPTLVVLSEHQVSDAYEDVD